MRNVLKIGNTPLKRLRTIENGRAEIYAKIEGENLGGSIKDRVALVMIRTAEKSGKLKNGGTVVEATSGNTGIGLAIVCREYGYKAVIVMPDSMSEERRKLLRSYGAELVLTDGNKGMQGAVDVAEKIAEQTPNCILADQFHNPVCATVHYETTAPEIWTQTDGRVDIFVACVGTGGTLTGVGRFLKEKNSNAYVVAVEPASSPLLSQGRSGAHSIQGIGANFVPSVLDRGIYDEVLTVTDEESLAMAKRLHEAENLYVGISSGAAAAAAQKLAGRKENLGKRIVTVFPDEGGRYASILHTIE